MLKQFTENTYEQYKLYGEYQEITTSAMWRCNKNNAVILMGDILLLCGTFSLLQMANKN